MRFLPYIFVSLCIFSFPFDAASSEHSAANLARMVGMDYLDVIYVGERDDLEAGKMTYAMTLPETKGTILEPQSASRNTPKPSRRVQEFDRGIQREHEAGDLFESILRSGTSTTSLPLKQVWESQTQVFEDGRAGQKGKVKSSAKKGGKKEPRKRQPQFVKGGKGKKDYF